MSDMPGMSLNSMNFKFTSFYFLKAYFKDLQKSKFERSTKTKKEIYLKGRADLPGKLTRSEFL